MSGGHFESIKLHWIEGPAVWTADRKSISTIGYADPAAAAAGAEAIERAEAGFRILIGPLTVAERQTLLELDGYAVDYVDHWRETLASLGIVFLYGDKAR